MEIVIEIIVKIIMVVVLSFSLVLSIMMLDNYLTYDVVFLNVELINNEMIQYGLDGTRINVKN